MRDRHVVTGKRLKGLRMVGLLVPLLLIRAVPGYARVSVVIRPGVVVPFGPSWAPYWVPYVYPYVYRATEIQPPSTVYAR